MIKKCGHATNFSLKKGLSKFFTIQSKSPQIIAVLASWLARSLATMLSQSGYSSSSHACDGSLVALNALGLKFMCRDEV